MMWFWPSCGWWGMGLGMLFMFVFWAGLIVLVVWVILKLVRSGQQLSSQTPLDIVKARYARGEISKEEFERIKKDLG